MTLKIGSLRLVAVNGWPVPFKAPRGMSFWRGTHYVSIRFGRYLLVAERAS